MVTLSISKKQAKDSEIDVVSEEGIDPDYLIQVIRIENFDLVVIIRPDTFYSYTTVLEEDGAIGLDRVLKEKTNKLSHQYITTKDKSIISKVSTIAKKYKHLVMCHWDDDKGPVKLAEIERVVNETPYKFLDFVCPAELESKFYTNIR